MMATPIMSAVLLTCMPYHRRFSLRIERPEKEQAIPKSRAENPLLIPGTRPQLLAAVPGCAAVWRAVSC